MKRLENKIAIITGGAQGIGKAAVKRFAEEGAVAIIWDVNEEKASATINEFKISAAELNFRKLMLLN